MPLATTTNAAPTIALAMGDPAGISPELTARLLELDELRSAARLVVFGDRRVLDAGAAVAGVELSLDTFTNEDDVPPHGERPIFVDLKNCDPSTIAPGEATLAGGEFATENFRRALLFAKNGKADAVCFTPFNKAA